MRMLILLLIIYILFLNIPCRRVVHCFTDNAGNNTFYVEESISPTGKGLTKIRIRTDYSQKGRSDFIKTLISRGTYNSKYDQLSHSVTAWRFDCSKKQNDLYAVYEYDKQYGIIASYKAKELDMEPVMPGTIGDILYRIACRGIR